MSQLGLKLNGMVVDSFAGGGGASTGIAWAIGRDPDIAINHEPEAVAMHRANHPHTEHLCQNVWQVDPQDIRRRGPIALAWFSPDCTHFSKAKGGKPVKRNIRDLAWVVILWAQRARPDVIMLENVEEFRDWGPLVDVGGGQLMPCPDRRGLTFRRWVGRLRNLGYRVDWRELRAADYGSPTIRKRLFVIARCDGRPIVWPEPTHAKGGEGGLNAWRSAAECIDWSIPCPSIFERRRSLADATMRRIARGVHRYVLEAAQPFIVPVTHAGDDRVHGIGEPLRTVTTASRGEHAVVVPSIVGLAHGTHVERPGARCHGLHEPVRTIHAGGGNHALIAPTLIQTGYGERPGQAPRALDLQAPLGTAVGGGAKHGLVAAFLAQHNTGMVGHDAREPVSTIVGKGCTQAVVAAYMAQHNGGRTGRPANDPLSTLVHRGTQQQLVAAVMHHAYSSNTCGGNGDPTAPAKTVTTGGHHALVAAFLAKYYGSAIGQRAGEPLHSATSKARFGLVTVSIEGVPYVIADIGMRMLTPRELFRAQGFPDSYVIDPIGPKGKPLTKTSQIRMCGNSVCPQVAAALVRANLGAAETAESVERIAAA